MGTPELEGKPYKSSGGEMVYNEELDKEVPAIWMKGKLNDIVDFSERRVLTSELTPKNYISTSNMLPDRGGIEESKSLPSVRTVTKFNKSNILISNIRPYFKKIWLAKFAGGCSNDVLCFVPKEKFSSLYLYFLLENDYFFDYVMRGAKGTKMPRGDKAWVMNFSIIVPQSNLTNQFSLLTSSLMRIIKLKNNETNILQSLVRFLLSKMASIENPREKEMA
ncbi:MAG: hypothetical protein RIB63_20965 [Fulvivirga sp.]